MLILSRQGVEGARHHRLAPPRVGGGRRDDGFTQKQKPTVITPFFSFFLWKKIPYAFGDGGKKKKRKKRKKKTIHQSFERNGYHWDFLSLHLFSRFSSEFSSEPASSEHVVPSHAADLFLLVVAQLGAVSDAVPQAAAVRATLGTREFGQLRESSIHTNHQYQQLHASIPFNSSV